MRVPGTVMEAVPTAEDEKAKLRARRLGFQIFKPGQVHQNLHVRSSHSASSYSLWDV